MSEQTHVTSFAIIGFRWKSWLASMDREDHARSVYTRMLHLTDED